MFNESDEVEHATGMDAIEIIVGDEVDDNPSISGATPSTERMSTLNGASLDDDEDEIVASADGDDDQEEDDDDDGETLTFGMLGGDDETEHRLSLRS